MIEFNPSSKHRERAVQAWQILISKAMNRQTITYKELSNIMYNKDAAGVLNRILGHIAFYCIDNKLPPLTSIVVGKGKGKPGSHIPIDLRKIDGLREKVYSFNKWFQIYPPLAKEFEDAFKKHMK